MKAAYPIILTDCGQWICVSVPDLAINTQGKDIADAIEMAEDAIGAWGITAQDMGQTIPEPSKTLPPCEPGSQMAFALVDFEAYRRANDQRMVRKNVTIQNYLNELAEKAGINFSQVLQEGLRERLGVQ